MRFKIYEVYVYKKNTQECLCKFYAKYTDLKDIQEQVSLIPEVRMNETTVILIKKTLSEMNKDLIRAHKKLKK